jgi:hypothetical protein
MHSLYKDNDSVRYDSIRYDLDISVDEVSNNNKSMMSNALNNSSSAAQLLRHNPSQSQITDATVPDVKQ